MNQKTYVMKIVGLASGGRTPFDGEYLREYDPGRDGVAPDGKPTPAHLVTTPTKAEAATFDFRGFHETWTRVDPRAPVRPDGKPNRPLTAFTVTTEEA